MIPDDTLRAALDALESHVGHPATVALHDPLYHLLTDQDPEQEELLVWAIRAHVDHPACSTLRVLLAPHIDLTAPDLETVLRDHGPIAAGASPIAEVDRRLRRADDREQVMLERISVLERRVDALRRLANGLAAGAAIVTIAGLIGWMVALGIVSFPWIEAPAPAADAVGLPGGDGLR